MRWRLTAQHACSTLTHVRVCKQQAVTVTTVQNLYIVKPMLLNVM